MSTPLPEHVSPEPVPQKPAGFLIVPPVRQPVTGSPARPGYPDGTNQNELGDKPIGKAR